MRFLEQRPELFKNAVVRRTKLHDQLARPPNNLVPERGVVGGLLVRLEIAYRVKKKKLDDHVQP